MRLGELQLAILKVLWARGPSSVTEVHKALPRAGGLAHTTIATMLRKMEARGLLTHREDGRRFVYAAAVAETEVSGGLADDLLDRVFEGRLADMVSHLLDTREVSPGELDELEKLIRARRKTR